jgi:hypothetical protein
MQQRRKDRVGEHALHGIADAGRAKPLAESVLVPTSVLVSAFLFVQRAAPPAISAVFLTDAHSTHMVVHPPESFGR